MRLNASSNWLIHITYFYVEPVRDYDVDHIRCNSNEQKTEYHIRTNEYSFEFRNTRSRGFTESIAQLIS